MTLRGLVTTLVILFPVSEAVLALAGRARARVVRRADEGSLRVLWLTIWFSVAAAVLSRGLFPAARFEVEPRTRDITALALLGAGLLFRWVSIVTLGRFFTVDVAIHEGHAVVQRGPYRLVRHPSYTGVLAAFLGLGVYFGNWMSLGLIIIPITLAFLRRIRTEEAALLQALGPAYADYCARTARLIPGIY